MRTATVTFEGKEYTIRELRHRPNKKWRKKLEASVGTIADTLMQGKDVDIAELTAVATLIREVAGFVINSVDTMAELLVEYCPNLSDAVENGFDSEVTDAFLEVLKLAYPFSKAIATLRQIGSQLPQTQRS